jgi:agmatine deiminase
MQQSLAREAMPDAAVELHRVPFGDIWLRDTAPIFLTNADAGLASVCFRFNGWGGKYVLEHDDGVSVAIARLALGRQFEAPFVLEGGAIEVDGAGTLMTTRQCLLHPNRNGRTDERAVESTLHQWLGIERVLWLGEGLENDHTDGHVDTVARFVRPGLVVAMEPRSADDPNRDVLRALLRQLGEATDAGGRRVEVVTIPSPGRVVDSGGRVMPASYVNFYLANACVVVPTYGARWDDEAVAGLGALFPDRRVVGIDARAVLTGGGAFHCITQQQPREST